MLNESIITFTPEEKKSISKWIKGLKRVSQRVLKNGPVEVSELTDAFNSYALRANKLTDDLDIQFVNNNPDGAVYSFSGVISINLSKTCGIQKDYDGIRPSVVLYVDFPSLISKLLHEFVHYKQNQIKTLKSGKPGLSAGYYGKNKQVISTKYFKNPYEQRAIAIQYLEYLKQQMDIEKPEEVISHLRRMGFLHRDDLTNLKKSDPKSWKAILKNAITQAQSELKKTLPWQKRKLP